MKTNLKVGNIQIKAECTKAKCAIRGIDSIHLVNGHLTAATNSCNQLPSIKAALCRHVNSYSYTKTLNCFPLDTLNYYLSSTEMYTVQCLQCVFMQSACLLIYTDTSKRHYYKENQ